MLKLKYIITIDKNDKKYLSFPDIIKSVKKPNRFLMVYRSGNGHHPTSSSLVLKRSENQGRSWRTIQEIELNLEEHGYVWNCPRLSYIGKTLYIVCDAKSGTYERQSHFKIFFLLSETDGNNIEIIDTPLPGMVPDKFIKFKHKYFCANHKIKNRKNELIQLMSWSKNGELWYNTNILAHDYKHQFCEASVVNMNNLYMIAYLRDNSGHKKNIYTVRSSNGVEWSEPIDLPVYGQRVTALRYDNHTTIGAYRNTDNINVSLFKHNLETNQINVLNIDEDYKNNQYNYGYTGLADNNKEYLMPYYIQKEEDNPYIKLAFIRK